jgi:glycosyltransferase involved in cell wall biosynthesis
LRDSGDWTPLVSVIVPVFDDAERLASCLTALQAQTYPTDRYEVVVVDNGSREDLGAVVAGFQGFGFVREDRVGSYAARNKGIEASKGEVLAFTDADCLPDPGWIEAGVRALAGRPEWRAVGGPIEMFAQDADRLTPFDLHDLVWGMPQRVYVERFGLAATANLFVHRSIFDQVGGFDPDFRSCGDCEWSFRLTAAGFELGYCREARIRHPTRSSLASFVRRRRRIAGGYHRLEPILSRYPEKEFEVPRSFAHSLGRMRRSWAHPLLDSTRRRLEFAGAELLLYGVTRIEGWRLGLGGEPVRS